jgi:hypothetical protein
MPLLNEFQAITLANEAVGSFCFLTSEDFEDVEQNRVEANCNRGTWLVYPA